MGEASIPVDLFNPGQVFACLGFLEAADVLLGDAEGGFDWSDESSVKFHLRAAGGVDPVATVLQFLAEAEVSQYAPFPRTGGVAGDSAESSDPTEDGDDDEAATAATSDIILSDTFPSRDGNRMALPIRLATNGGQTVVLSHWSDGSGRNDFKLYSGNRSACGIARAMLHGKRKKPTKKQKTGDLETKGVAVLWQVRRAELLAKPFDVLTLMRGSFNFDPRGAWTALDAGYSPDQQSHGIAASPVVEILSAWGLEHARPDEYHTRQVRYAAWAGAVPPALARPALAGVNVGIRLRRFEFTLEMSGKNKVVTYAQEETKP